MTHFSGIELHVGTMGLSFCSLLFVIRLPNLCFHFSMKISTSSASSIEWVLNPFSSLDKREVIKVLLTDISHVRLSCLGWNWLPEVPSQVCKTKVFMLLLAPLTDVFDQQL